MNRKVELLVLSCWCLAGAVHAQDEVEEKPLPPRQVRFLTLGDLPPYRQEIRGGVRYELAPPPGSIPPREVLVGAGDEAAGGVRLTLGRVSRGLKVPPGAGPLVLRRMEDAADVKPWIQITRPETGDFLVVLWRDRKTGSWERALTMILPEGAPRGSVTFLNVAGGPMAVALGAEQFMLPPGKPIRRPLGAGKPLAFQVGLRDGEGGLKSMISRSLEQEAGERTLVLLYRSDGRGARTPIGVKVHREAVPATLSEGESRP